MSVKPPYWVIPGSHFERFPSTFQEFNMRIPVVWMPYKRRL
ncbi:hypothetical protein [Thermofilum sp.]|nr:hypothetical protein [Thermofilum sp.]